MNCKNISNVDISVSIGKMSNKICILVLVFSFVCDEGNCHGRLMEPPNRSSIWRFREFASFNPPVNYNDNELSCGGFSEQYVKNGGRCGSCGDRFHESTPRANENEGIYGRGIIVRKYVIGQKIPVAIQLTRSHLGYFEFQLCQLSSSKAVETESCFGEKLLLGEGSTTKYNIPTLEVGYFNTSVILPKKPCERCVFRWNYRTGNSWGNCGNGTEGLGCGNQEIFRGCADILIS